MSVGQYCNRDVVIIDAAETVDKAVELMRHHHVGDVIAVERVDGASRPLGILTDCDVVLEILAARVDMESVCVRDVVNAELHRVGEHMELLDAIKLMRTHAVRRLPVVDASGALVGILSVDDVLELIAEQFSDLVALTIGQRSRERELRD